MRPALMRARSSFFREYQKYYHGLDLSIANQSADGWYDVHGFDAMDVSDAIGGFVVEVRMTCEAALALTGRLPSKRDWWRDVRRMYIWARDGNMHIELRDGRTEESNIYLPLPPIKPGAKLYLQFGDQQGRMLSVLNDSGDLLGQFDLTDIEGLELPEGIFPGGFFYPGVILGPGTRTSITQFSLSLRDE